MGKSVLVIGSGGREHAFAWKLAQSPRAGKIYVAPGNGGTGGGAGNVENVAIAATDIPALVAFAKEKKIDLVLVGPDDPLAMGVVDAFRAEDIPVFGPTQGAAQIEASKAFAKEIMQGEAIPTARFGTFTDHSEALAYLRAQTMPVVVKASGLALGKGVTICRTIEEAETALADAMVRKVFGEAGSTVVIEEFLEGEEFSAHALADGETFVLLPSSQDHKRAGEGNTGPNTGGMGTIAPVPWVSEELMGKIGETIVAPALRGLAKSGAPFTGLLYPGLMMTPEGPKVLEFNARWGDPETQSYMRLLKTDLFDVIEACTSHNLASLELAWHPGFACCVVLASGGYPGKYEKGLPITGIEEAEKVPGVVVFHAGTAVQNGQLVTAGGRVLGVSAIGATLEEALSRAYEAAGKIAFDGMQYRKDIGKMYRE